MEAMQVDFGEENDNVGSSNSEVLVESTTLDLESYVANFQGLAKLYRLLHIADRCQSLHIEALRMALAYIMSSTHNTNMYLQIYKKVQETANSQLRLPPDTAGALPPIDSHWVELTAKRAAVKLERLDMDLKNYKTNLIKESVRRGHDDLGDHYLDCGDLTNALKCYSRARDYCTSPKLLVDMCLNVIRVSIYLQNWSHVSSYVSKGETTLQLVESTKENPPPVLTKLRAAAGLADLACSKYKTAAKFFLQAVFDHVDFPELLSANNIATYGALCALATFDRQELHRYIISSSTFKLFLETEPQLRDILYQFYNSKYASCLKLLDSLKDNFLLDLYLADHISALFAQIRSRALCQYFSPYLSVDMHKMASSFNTTIAVLEDELMQLILDGRISARIDSHNKVLYAKDTDQRSVTFEKCLDVGLALQTRSQALLLRVAVLKNQIQVKSPQREGIGGRSLPVYNGQLPPAAPTVATSSPTLSIG
jgi:COP9 signalosome complex subunit 1